jgi:hypothetical protein
MDDNDAKSTGGQVPHDADLRERVSMAAKTPGLKIMVGSGVDGSTFVHGTQALEFAGLVKRGMTTAAAIQSGTIINAEAMGWKDAVGLGHQGQVRRSRRGIGRPARGHYRVATREVRDEGRQGDARRAHDAGS